MVGVVWVELDIRSKVWMCDQSHFKGIWYRTYSISRYIMVHVSGHLIEFFAHDHTYSVIADTQLIGTH